MKNKWINIDLTLPQLRIVYAIFIVACAWAIVYYSFIPSLLMQWNNEDNSHSYLVVPVFIYMLWQVRQNVLDEARSSWTIPLLIILFSVVLLISGRLGSLETFVYLSMWVSLLGIFILFFGVSSLRHGAFSFAILAFALPLPQFVNSMISLKLKLWSSALAFKMLQVMSIPVYREGNIIDLGVARLQVVDACSGLRYLFPTIFLALIAGHFFLKTSWARVVLVVISPFVCLVSNSLRIAVTGVLVRVIDPALAEGFFHDFSGWLVYMFMLVLLAGILAALKYIEGSSFKRNEHAADVSAKNNAAQAGLSGSWISMMPYKALLAAMILAGGFTVQHQLVNSQTIPVRQDFSTFPDQIGEWQGRKIYLSPGVLKSLWADDYISGNYTHSQTGNSLHLLISYYETQTTRKTAHAPTSCLLGGGWILVSKTLSEPDPENGRDFPVRSMVMEQMGDRILANFWFEQRGRHITSEYFNKLYLFWDALTVSRTDGALVRVEMHLNQDQSVEEAQLVLNGFVAELSRKIKIYVPGRPELQHASLGYESFQ